MINGEVYVDESGTHDRSPILTVAGYLFESQQARRFSRDWQQDLNSIPLPFAHQTDCATGNGNYADLSMDSRVRSEKLLIENIKRRSRFGFGACVDPHAYGRIVGTANNAPSAYTYALQSCFVILGRWAARTRFSGQISYYFEAGHRSQGEADRYFRDALLESERSKLKHRYAGHSFVDKREALPLQAADLLAWQYQHYHARRIEKGILKPRADFEALMRNCDVCIEHDDAALHRFKDQIVDEGWLIDRY